MASIRVGVKACGLIWLPASGSDRFVSQDSVEVFVGYEIYLPLVIRESQIGLAKLMMRGVGAVEVKDG